MRPRTENGARVAAELRARLRDADPLGAGAHDAAAEELALTRLAARIETDRGRLASAPPARRFAFGAPLLAMATIGAVAWLGVRFAERPRPAAGGDRSAAAVRATPSAAVDRPVEAGSSSRPSSGGGEPEARQIQFETSGGTRVIWVLDPRFTL